MKRAIVLALQLGLAGCASKPTQPLHGVRQVPALPAAQLLFVPAVIANDGATDMRGELSLQARAAFNQNREAMVRRVGDAPRRPGSGAEAAGNVIGGCLQAAFVLPVVGIALCPIIAVGGAALYAAEPSIAQARAAADAYSLLVTDDDAAALVAFINERVNAGALAHHTAELVAPAEIRASQPQDSKLVIHLQSVELSQSHRVVRPGRVASTLGGRQPKRLAYLELRVTAEARAISAAGAALSPTQHVFEWRYGPISDWSSEDRKAVQEAFVQALSALAHSIVSAHARAWKLSEVEEQPKQSTLAVDADATLERTAADSSILIDSTASSLPRVGDTWTYRLTRPNQPSRQYQFTVVSALPELIVERAVAADGTSSEIEHRKGSYLVPLGDFTMFSPYLRAFAPITARAASAKVQNADPGICNSVTACSTRVLIGEQWLQVGTRELLVTRVEIQQTWRGLFGRGERPLRTITAWYAPEIKRVVKISSRAGSFLTGDLNFDLELEGYRLN